jgi:hypothetical protein
MQTETIKVELLINGQNVTVGHEYLEDTVRYIPDIEENIKIFDILALSNNPEVRARILINDLISEKTIHKLIEDQNEEVVDNILSNSDLSKHIKNKTLMKIIKSDNIKYLKTIARNIEDYTKCKQCKIVKILSNHKNPLVRYNLINYSRSDLITTKILKKLAKDKDIDVATEAKSELKRKR